MGRPRSPQAHSGSTATSTSKVESCPRQLGGRVSIRGRCIRTARQPDCRCNAAWCAMPSPHTSTPTDSPYDSATPEVMAKHLGDQTHVPMPALQTGTEPAPPRGRNKCTSAQGFTYRSLPD
ncbi:hypothetical protein B296_00013723, partial [Ensete ventricosum]